MKLTLLLLATLLLALSAPMGAEPITVTVILLPSIHAGSSGATVTFSGTVHNDSLDTAVYLNGATITYAGPDSDSMDFVLNAAGLLPAGGTIGPVDLFTAVVGAGCPCAGVFTVQGGTVSVDDDAVLGSAGFEVDLNGTPGATVPEPGTWILAGVGGVALAVVRRSRR